MGSSICSWNHVDLISTGKYAVQPKAGYSRNCICITAFVRRGLYPGWLYFFIGLSAQDALALRTEPQELTHGHEQKRRINANSSSQLVQTNRLASFK